MMILTFFQLVSGHEAPLNSWKTMDGTIIHQEDLWRRK